LKELLLIVAERDWYRVVQGDAQQCQSDTVVYHKAYHKTYHRVLVDTGERMNVTVRNGTEIYLQTEMSHRINSTLLLLQLRATSRSCYFYYNNSNNDNNVSVAVIVVVVFIVVVEAVGFTIIVVVTLVSWSIMGLPK
jgi:hypothetical protein